MRLTLASILVGSTLMISGLPHAQSEDPAWALPPTPNGATAFDFKLKGYVFGLRMIKSSYTGFITNDDYAVRADLRTSGLGALLKKLRIWAVTTGQTQAGDFRPLTHVQQNQDKKNRRVEMAYDNAAERVTVDINPRLGSQGVPPASPEERYSADDTLSAILNMITRGQAAPDGKLCSGSVRVFDSKQHYNLRMQRDGTKRMKYDGQRYDAVRCLVYYEPISGFDPEDLPNTEEGGTPVKIYFKPKPEHGLYVPLRFTYKISGFKAVIKITDIDVRKT